VPNHGNNNNTDNKSVHIRALAGNGNFSLSGMLKRCRNDIDLIFQLDIHFDKGIKRQTSS